MILVQIFKHKTKKVITSAAPQPARCIAGKGELVAYSVMSTGIFATGEVKKPFG